MSKAYIVLALLIFTWLPLSDIHAGMNQTTESNRPKLPDGAIEVPATLKSDPIRVFQMGTFKAIFEETTLSAIMGALGKGSIQLSRATGESQYWLCYSLPHQRIWLISNGEMGGPDHTLTQVQAVSTKTLSQEDAACPQIPTSFQPISMNFGWLETSKEQLLASLGPASGRKDSRLMFFYKGKEPGMYEGKKVEWDIIAYIEAIIVDNKVSSLYISHVTTY